MPNSRGRQLLQRFADGGDGKGVNILSAREKKEFLAILMEENPNLHSFCLSVDKESLRAPKELKDLFLSLASPSPVCSYIHPSEVVGGLIQNILKGVNLQQNPLQWHQLHEECPVLFSAFKHDNTFLLENDHFKFLLVELWNKACVPFVTAPELSQISTGAVIEDDLSFFPSLTKYRNRGIFPTDKERTKTPHCEKNYRGHPSLLPGIFTMFCPHGM